jgi:iron complex outermembrane receptor protein
VVCGIGERVSNNATEREAILFFDPSGRHLALYNAFVQDEIALKGDKLHLILGIKAEHYSLSGGDAQPSARLVYSPNTRHTVWTAISRAVRIPTQFDDDLRIALPTIVLVQGDRRFSRENLIAYEAGYRLMPVSRFSLDIAGYYNDYDSLRSQERRGTAIVLGNGLRANNYGAEVTAAYQVQPWWRMTAAYSNFQKHFSLDSRSTDVTGGLQEGMDPRNQVSLRSAMDLPHKWELDFWMRHVSALEVPSGPPVPPYTVFDVRAGWRPVDRFEISLVGRNLPQMRHAEFGPAGELVRRTVYVTTAWRF